MRKLFNFFAAALVMLAAASCEKNEVLPDNNSEGKVVTLNASINNGGTKTSLGNYDATNNEYPVLWSKWDKIAVIQGNNIYEFTLDGEGGSSSGTFTCSETGNFDPSQGYKAFYPYSCVTKVDGVIKYTIPESQNYVEDNFAPGSVPMVASKEEGENGELQFTHLSGALKLQLKGSATIRSIEVVNDSEISGVFRTDNDYFNTNITQISYRPGSKWVTLDCGEGGVQLSTSPTNFIIAISKHNGCNLTIIITDINGNRRVLRIGLKQEITAGNIIKMPVVVFEPQANEYIVEENGKSTYYGAGVQVGETIWAPVNCGYEPATSDGNKGFPRGKYYQWGRKDGYGYQSASNYNEVISGEGHPNNIESNKFYLKWNWEDASLKTDGVWKKENNPCPEGWQVPSKQQMENLISKNSGIGTSGSYKDFRYGIYGTWFSGSNTYSDALEEKVFLERYGYVSTSVQNTTSNSYGAYWTSSNYYLQFGKTNNTSINPIIIPGRQPYNYAELKSCALNVRCVKSPNPIES